MLRLVVALAILTVVFAVYPKTSSTAAATAADAAATYRAKCAACHAADGSGNTAVGKAQHLRDLRSAEVQGQSDAQLLGIIANGKGKMPGYQKSLGADQCKALVAYIRSLRR